MKFLGIENFRLTDRNKANGDAVFEVGDHLAKADFNFYLQGEDCLSIRLGRHDVSLKTDELEAFLKDNMLNIRKLVKPEVERVRRERREQMNSPS
ncbi:MAG TPA: hypothetical protein PLP71_10420 [Syntrophomonadaceae bacterium]|nr:hypothetical protein [Syntrophomonadaceae bacterium]